jgi:Uncharacterized protein involved in tolerance to divalent cations
MIELHVTFADMESARALSRRAVEARLAACANILPGVTSIYRWQGRIEEETETLAILKTSDEQAGALARFVADNHPYETPAIVRHENVTANESYLDWIAAETGTTTR